MCVLSALLQVPDGCVYIVPLKEGGPGESEGGREDAISAQSSTSVDPSDQARGQELCWGVESVV